MQPGRRPAAPVRTLLEPQPLAQHQEPQDVHQPLGSPPHLARPLARTPSPMLGPPWPHQPSLLQVAKRARRLTLHHLHLQIAFQHPARRWQVVAMHGQAHGHHQPTCAEALARLVRSTAGPARAGCKSVRSNRAECKECPLLSAHLLVTSIASIPMAQSGP